MTSDVETSEATQPTAAECRKQIRLLRAFVEDESNDALERRIAQVKEDTLRWAFEKTTWMEPVSDVGFADIIRNDPGCFSADDEN